MCELMKTRQTYRVEDEVGDHLKRGAWPIHGHLVAGALQWIKYFEKQHESKQKRDNTSIRVVASREGTLWKCTLTVRRSSEKVDVANFLIIPAPPGAF